MQVQRQERRKTGNFREAPSITSLVEDKTSSTIDNNQDDSSVKDSVTNVPETPSTLSLEDIEREANVKARRESTASTFSDWFDTSRYDS